MRAKSCKSHIASVSVTDWCIMIFLLIVFFFKVYKFDKGMNSSYVASGFQTHDPSTCTGHRWHQTAGTLTQSATMARTYTFCFRLNVILCNPLTTYWIISLHRTESRLHDVTFKVVFVNFNHHTSSILLYPTYPIKVDFSKLSNILSSQSCIFNLKSRYLMVYW